MTLFCIDYKMNMNRTTIIKVALICTNAYLAMNSDCWPFLFESFTTHVYFPEADNLISSKTSLQSYVRDSFIGINRERERDVTARELLDTISYDLH